MASKTHNIPFIPFFVPSIPEFPPMGSSGTTRGPLRSPEELCNEKIFKIFDNFQKELSSYIYFSDIPHIQECTKTLSIINFNSSIKDLQSGPDRKTPEVALARFAKFLPCEGPLSSFSCQELDIALQAFLKTEPGCPDYEAFTARSSSAEEYRSARSGDTTHLTTKTTPDSPPVLDIARSQTSIESAQHEVKDVFGIFYRSINNANDLLDPNAKAKEQRDATIEFLKAVEVMGRSNAIVSSAMQSLNEKLDLKEDSDLYGVEIGDLLEALVDIDCEMNEETEPTDKPIAQYAVLDDFPDWEGL